MMLSAAEESQIQAFLEVHKGVLKRKLRDVRGDTFFTMMTKMASDLIDEIQRMPPINVMKSGLPPMSPQAVAAGMRETYLQFVRRLPTDVLNARDYLGQTALMLAADRKDGGLLDILITKRVDLDPQDTLGRTALHSAAKSNALDCFTMLLEAGADPTLRTCAGKTPAILAAELGRATIFKRRLEHAGRQMSEEELQEARRVAAHNERLFKKVGAAYAKQGVKLGRRNSFKAIMDATDQRMREPGL